MKNVRLKKRECRTGTQFQNSVWNTLYKIPKGNVTTYAYIARYLQTNAIRAVGTAVGKNPHAPKCPCHRVVRSDGSVGNYSGRGGIQKKIALLKREGVVIKNKKIDLTRCGVDLTQLT